MTLRAYQQTAIDSVLNFFRSTKGEMCNPLVVAPTGSGKSHIIAGLCSQIIKRWPEVHITVAQHRKELIQQNFEKFVKMAPEITAGVFSAGLRSRDIKQVTFAGIQTVFNKAPLFAFQHLLIVDEAHLIPREGEGRYRTFIEGLRKVNPKMKVIGLTATPYRLDSGHLCEGENALFSDVCYDIELRGLIDDGYLSKLISSNSKNQANLDTARTRGGEFMPEDIARIMDETRLVESAVTEIIRKGENRKSWLLFCSGVKHSEHVSAELKKRGISAECITGETPPMLRQMWIERFKKGELQAITNCDVLTTGFDAPNVDMVVLLRPTQSTGLYVQMVGRGCRLSPGKENCLILDFAGNIKRFGPVDLPQINTQNGSETPFEVCISCDHVYDKKLEKCPQCGELPKKLCKSCGSVNLKTAEDCFACGAPFASSTPRKVKHEVEPEKEALILSEIEEKNVVNVMYRVHQKEGKPDSMRVDYLINNGFDKISEYVCFEHGGYASHKAKYWWKRHNKVIDPDTPETTEEAISRLKELRKPSKIRVMREGKFYRVKEVDFHTEETLVDARSELYEKYGLNL